MKGLPPLPPNVELCPVEHQVNGYGKCDKQLSMGLTLIGHEDQLIDFFIRAALNANDTLIFLQFETIVVTARSTLVFAFCAILENALQIISEATCWPRDLSLT